jgi:hypothetical protein
MQAAKNDTGTINTLNTRKFCVRALDVSGPEGVPWTDLKGKALSLAWVLSREEVVLCRGKVASDGWVIIPLGADTEVTGLTLWIGLPSSGPPQGSSPVQGIESGFEWCEKYSLGEEPEVEHPAEEAIVLLNRLGYHGGVVERPFNLLERAAVANFQREHKMKVTAKLDYGEAIKIGEQMGRLSKQAEEARSK